MKTLHVDSIRKSFQNRVILSDIYLTCNQGEIVGLLGRNGMGKSTLLKIIFGSEKADQKFVRAGSRIVRNITDGRKLINYLPQENFMPNGVRIQKLIDLFLEPQHRQGILEHDYIKPLLYKKNGDLSGGERRIVEILLLLHSKADFLLLDEPFNGLSPVLRDYICEYIRQLTPQKGIIISDHDYVNIIKLSDRMLLLKDGHLREVKAHTELVELGYLPKSHS
ncbi:ATP-binding cassette domain-containing protein [Robiginitalea sp. M366]|uniref:ATP-binding cassette domain-containing protein n=1 Tax=Robiginitalea aestuariiviva TaxID=3036903 RepID=UPI00240DB468|nr:ATP-binding cassette domain-containing protein [Robiginitalea aestuariiviva]MDG1571142.1 ATP-binding cassette domain-containing protein [Robiginitalea aestuariiviva]